MKKNIINSLVLGLSIVPSFVLAAGVGDVTGIIDLVRSIFSAILPLIMTLAVIYFLWSLTKYMTKAGAEQAEAKEQMMWGVIILFVMVSVWGLVGILDKTIFG
ncbi:pilin [Patescibacteria group bacterium]|nr:pilin [Patescibacteria group bacterium]